MAVNQSRSPLTTNTLLYTWMCPFGDPPTIKGDHWLLGLKFDPEILFGSSTDALTALGTHEVKSHQLQTITKYCKQVIMQCQKHQIVEWIDHPSYNPGLPAWTLCRTQTDWHTTHQDPHQSQLWMLPPEHCPLVTSVKSSLSQALILEYCVHGP